MVLPLYLAMSAVEMDTAALPPHWGVMISGSVPAQAALPPGGMLILTDRAPWGDPREIAEAAKKLNCQRVLLDLEREPDETSRKVADALFQALPCPVAAPPGFVDDPACGVFLPPCPLHVPLAEYLLPWQGRDIWLDVTLRQQTITVTAEGTRYSPAAPADRQDGGRFDEILTCRCVTEISEKEARFTLFDTSRTLQAKLEQAAALGVSGAVGLYQELAAKL